MSDLVPYRRSGVLGRRAGSRAVGDALAEVQTGALLERAADEARLRLAVSRMADIGQATHHALGEGDDIVRELASRVEANPLAANALGGIAEDGIRGIRHQLRRLTGGQ